MKGLPGRKKASTSKVMKPNDESKDSLTRFTPVIIPPKMSKTIKPDSIFDPVSSKGKGKAKKKTKKWFYMLLYKLSYTVYMLGGHEFMIGLKFWIIAIGTP